MDSTFLAELSDDELLSALHECQAVEQSVRVDKLALVSEARRRGAHLGDGARSTSDWVAGHLSLSAHSARQLCRVGARLEELPEVAKAFESAEISWDQLVPITDLADPDSDTYWAREGRGFSPEQLAALARRARRRSRESEADKERNPFCHVFEDVEERSATGWFKLYDDDAKRFITALEAIAKNECRSAVGEPRANWPVRCGQALALMAHDRLSEHRNQAKATINVHISIEDLAEGAGGTITPGDIQCDAEVLERLACGGRWKLIFDARDGEPLAFTESRPPAPAVEQAILRRDVHCVWKGCRSRHGEIHHIVWWSKGGKTKFSNLVFLCWHHHRLVHEGGWRLTGTADNIEVRRPNGTMVFRTGPPTMAAA